jgi:diguanylate cyclase
MDEIVKEVVRKERESFSVELIEKETAEGFSNYISMVLYPMEMPDGEDGLLLVFENIRVGSVIQRLTQRYSELRLSQSRLMRIAMTDPVTGLGNRYAYEHDASERALAVLQNPVDLVVAVMGLDGLKVVNAARGHAQGDVLLRTYAATLQSILRDGDIVYRVGGDEFIAVLETSAYAGFERLYQKFEDVVEQVRRAGFPDTQVSVGLAALSETGYNMVEAIRLADRRMYAYRKKLYGKDV